MSEWEKFMAAWIRFIDSGKCEDDPIRMGWKVWQAARATAEQSEPTGWKLAMRVLQSDLYATLDDAERAECDALIRANPYSASRGKT